MQHAATLPDRPGQAGQHGRTPPGPARTAPPRPHPNAPAPALSRVDRALLAGYVAVSALKILGHEMWRDELQAWTLARSSGGIGQLLERVRYEQHPPGWYLLLWAASRISGSPRAEQAVLLSLVALLAWLVLRFAPYPRPLRWLTLFGYFTFFEYSTLARPYILDLILALVAVTLIRQGRTGWTLGLALMALVLVDDGYGTALTAALLVAAYLRASGRGGRLRDMARATGTAVAALGLAAACSVPPPGYYGPTIHLSGDGLRQALQMPAQAIAAIPVPVTNFWGSSVIDGCGWVAVAVLSVALAAAVAVPLRSDGAALACWLTGLPLMMAFLAATDIGGARFVGMAFVLLLAALWLHPGVASWSGRPAGTLGRRAGDGARLPRVALLAVLALQVPGALVATTVVALHPFSEAEAAAAVVRRLPGVVVAAPDWTATPVAGYADRRLYLAISGRFGTYAVWNRADSCGDPRQLDSIAMPQGCTGSDIDRRAEEAVRQEEAATRGPVWLLLDYDPGSLPGIRLVRAFQGAVVTTEDYWLFSARG